MVPWKSTLGLLALLPVLAFLMSRAESPGDAEKQEADLIEIALLKGEFKPSKEKKILLNQVNRGLCEWIRSQEGFDPKSVGDGRSPAVSGYDGALALSVNVFGLADREHILGTVDRYWELLRGSNVKGVTFHFYREEVRKEVRKESPRVVSHEPSGLIARLELNVPDHL